MCMYVYIYSSASKREYIFFSPCTGHLHKFNVSQVTKEVSKIKKKIITIHSEISTGRYPTQVSIAPTPFIFKFKKLINS